MINCVNNGIELDAKSTEAGDLLEFGIKIFKINDIRPTKFCIVGERCSGTNLAQFLVSKHFPNLRFRPEIFGWKHGFPQKIGYAEDTLIIVLARDVFSWIKSLYRKPWHSTDLVQQRSFSAFIRGSWETDILPPQHFGIEPRDAIAGRALQLDRHPITGRTFETPLDLRNVKYQSYLGLKNREVNVAIIQMETLIRDPKLFLTCLAISFDLSIRGKVQLPELILGQYNRIIPLPSPVPAEISTADTSFILQQLDLLTEAEIGYSYPYAQN